MKNAGYGLIAVGFVLGAGGLIYNYAIRNSGWALTLGFLGVIGAIAGLLMSKMEES